MKNILSCLDINKEQNRALLEGKPFNLAEETPSKALVDSANFKNIVTGGEMVIKSVYKKPYSVPNTAKLIMSCNEIPKSADTTSALYRRMLIVPWNRVFQEGTPGHDPFILQKLLLELPGIFNLVIAGYRRLKAQSGFTKSALSDQALTEYKESSDTVIPWAKEELAVAEFSSAEAATECADFTGVKRLYQHYKFWAEERGFHSVNFDTWSKRFHRLLSFADSRKSRQRAGKRGENKKETVYKGVKLLEEAEDF